MYVLYYTVYIIFRNLSACGHNETPLPAPHSWDERVRMSCRHPHEIYVSHGEIPELNAGFMGKTWKHNEAQWSTMKHNETQWNTMKHNEAQWSTMKHNETLWNTMKHYETQWNTMKHYETQWNIKHNDIQTCFNGGWNKAWTRPKHPLDPSPFAGSSAEIQTLQVGCEPRAHRAVKAPRPKSARAKFCPVAMRPVS